MSVPDPFDPEAHRLPGSDLQAPASRPVKRPPRHRPGEWFLRGPVPWPWLERAARLPGKALALALVLWREAGRTSCRTVKVSLGRLTLAVSEQGGRRALRRLEAAGVVSVRRRPGNGLEVTIRDTPPTGRGGREGCRTLRGGHRGPSRGGA